MSERETAGFLATVPLFEGRDEAELAELARVLRRRTTRAGQVLWRQGDQARELLLVVEGAVTAQLHVSGDRTVELGTAGPGEIVGEVGLLDGQGHTASVTVSEAGAVMVLGRLDFEALLTGRSPSAFVLKRRLAALFTARTRHRLELIAAALGGPPEPPPSDGVDAELEESSPADSKYVRRMATFHDFDPLALWGFLTSGRYVRCPAGRTLLAEGAASPAYYLTVNGAVERVLVRGDRRVRVGLAGPGKAFGYEGMIDGRPSPFTAITRERSLLLVLPRDLFVRLFDGHDAVARSFLDVIQNDLMATWRETLRLSARVAAERAPHPLGGMRDMGAK